MRRQLLAPSEPFRGCLRYGCAGLSSLAFLAGASAQIAPPPGPLDFSGQVQGLQAQPSGAQVQPSGAQVQPSGPVTTSVLAPPSMAPLPEQSLLQWGPVGFYPHFLYRFLYGDGVPAQPGEHFATAINEVYPGILLKLGQHWQLDYTPSLRYYSSSHFQDTTDHSVALNGGTTYENWTFGLSQRYATTSQPLIETGAQTDLETYDTAINAACQFNTKTSLEMGFNQGFQYVDQNASSGPLTDSKVWSTMDWLNYQFWPKFGAALGVGGGYADLSLGSSMSYEQLKGRITWQVSDKVSVSASGGLDDRQFVDSTQPDLLNPIFTVSAFYRPFEATTLSLDASRTVSPSYFEGLVTETTAVGGGLHQRFFKKLNLDFSTGYGVTSYELTSPGPNPLREDHFTYVNVRLSVPFLKRGTAGVFYQASKNTSTVSTYQISSTQVGFDLAYHF